MTRICITGGPRTGKTTLAGELWRAAVVAWVAEHGPIVDLEGPVLMHTDDVVHLGWSQASEAASKWFDTSGPWIIEGVAVSRALRKWREAHPGEPPPVDRVIYLTETFEEPTPGQRSMAKGVETVHREIEFWLAEHGVRTEFLIQRELTGENVGWNGIAMLGPIDDGEDVEAAKRLITRAVRGRGQA